MTGRPSGLLLCMLVAVLVGCLWTLVYAAANQPSPTCPSVPAYACEP